MALWGCSPSLSLVSTDTLNERDGGQPMLLARHYPWTRALHRAGKAGNQAGEV